MSDGNHTEEDLRDKSLPELLGDLTREMSDLVSGEIAMAKAELSEKISLAGQGAGLISASMIALLMAFGAATALAVIALDKALALWLAALIVTGFWSLMAVVLVLLGRERFKLASATKPEKPVDRLKEDAKWVIKQTR